MASMEGIAKMNRWIRSRVYLFKTDSDYRGERIAVLALWLMLVVFLSSMMRLVINDWYQIAGKWPWLD